MPTKMNKMEAQWRAQDDARIMAQYQEIISDKDRMSKAIKEAQKTAKDLAKRASAMQTVARTRTSGKKK
jgi:hypothetical protein